MENAVILTAIGQEDSHLDMKLHMIAGHPVRAQSNSPFQQSGVDLLRPLLPAFCSLPTPLGSADELPSHLSNEMAAPLLGMDALGSWSLLFKGLSVGHNETLYADYGRQPETTSDQKDLPAQMPDLLGKLLICCPNAVSRSFLAIFLARSFHG